jgi:cyclophilin family peptidyl-prolyl cis-trans isomerase
MANAGANTNGSQFFITYGPQPHLNGKHGVFGQLVGGKEVLDAIRERDPDRDPKPGDSLKSVEIIES